MLKKIICLCILLSAASVGARTSDPTVVKDINLEAYMGTWYEIGHSPNFFQRLCQRSMAEYSLNEKGTVDVVNTCFRDEKVFRTIRGEAKAPHPEEPAKLVVDFGFFRKGDYWIVGLDPDYQWAVVSGPQKKSLFILARVAPMSPALLSSILEDLESRGFNTSKIIFDEYPESP